MANSGKMANRDFPQNFDHPRLYKQLSVAEFDAVSTRQMEEHAGLCRGHKKTIVHFADGENRRFILEVVLKTGRFFIESPCTYTPGFGIDALDGNLARDAEIWILVQQLGVNSKRLETLFGINDHLYYEDYIRLVSYHHARDEFEDVQEAPVITETATNTSASINGGRSTLSADEKKKWWKFW